MADATPTRIPVAYWVQQARAAIRAARETCCDHGIARNVCADCPTDPTDHPTEETA